MRPRAIFLDFGDTLAEESSEVRDDAGAALSAELVPSARPVVEGLRAAGYPLALVVDCVPGTGRRTYENVLAQHGMLDLFAAVVTSDEAEAEKPEPGVFLLAARRLAVADDELAGVMMVGNRLERDVVGANRLGLVSVWLRRPDGRYRTEIEAEDERPDHVIEDLPDLLALVDT